MHRWKKLLLAEEGVTTVEYAMLLALIILESVGTLGSLGTKTWNIFVLINASL